MRVSVDHKVPGGKLLRVDITFYGDIIRGIMISGDFFIHPEESIKRIEESLIGADSSDRKGMEDRLHFIVSDGIKLVGVSQGSIIHAVMEARKILPKS